MALISSAVESIQSSLSGISASDDHSYAWENPRRFYSHAQRLQLVLNQLLRSSSPENLPASAQTAVKGIAGDLVKAEETLSVYRKNSKIFVLINCLSLTASLQECAVAIGGWLALLDSALHDIPDLLKKVADLSTEMKQAQFKVSENENRLHCTLQKEGQGRQTSKAVQSAIIMDLARALGVDSSNHTELSEQIKLLENDLACSNSPSERRILMSLKKIMDNWSIEPDNLIRSFNFDFDDDGQISPFKNFLCPLTKQVMKQPVVLDSSSQTYERSAIEYWFERCVEDGRDPTCPVTGQILKSLEVKPNLGLAGAIEEWLNRNIDIQIKLAVQCLSEDFLKVDETSRMLDNIYLISEDHPSSRYKVRNAGIITLVVRVLNKTSKIAGPDLRSKGLMLLLSMSKDEESKKIMLEDGITRLAIHSLIGRSEKEREYAVKLILEFSSDETYCAKIASEKGALVLLSSMAGNLEHPALSNLAEETLRQMEKVDNNVQPLAAAGRFEPLLQRLCEGSNDVKVRMASLMGSMTLTNCSKEHIARRSARILVELLANPEGRGPSLEALYNLSSLDDNATILVDSAVLPALTSILFDSRETPLEVKALAASIVANIVSKPGHWELASVHKKGHPIQSESIVKSFLGLLSLASSQCQLSVLKILFGMASSPKASESVAAHVISGDGLKIITTFLEHPEAECRSYAYKLTRVLSETFGKEVADVLKASNKLSVLKDTLTEHQSDESSDAACILANLPLTEDDVRSVFGPSFLKWLVSTLKGQCHASSGKIARPKATAMEGLLGLSLHFTRSADPESVSLIKENRLMSIFVDPLVLSSIPKVKKLAALGLKYLSETGMIVVAKLDSEPKPPHGFFSSLVFMCGKTPKPPPSCPIHNSPCEEESQFCLLKSNCIKPLVDALSEEDTSVQIAATEALSTLIAGSSNGNLKRAVEELDDVGVVDEVIRIFLEARPGDLQEKAIWMVERMLRVESVTHRHSLNQSLVRALVEALKHGSAVTKRLSQEALTNLKQISGVSGRATSQTQARR